MFRPIVTGKDTFQTEAIFDAMLKVGSVSGPTGALLTAASGIDIALWDIKGKALVVPIYELLGGIKPGREKVRVYASSLVRDLSPVDDAKRAADFQEQRFTGYKMHSAVPGAIDHPADQTVESVREMRSATGDNFDIFVDVNSAYYVHHAIEIGKRLEDHDVFHFEEPVALHGLSGLAKVADALTIPIASGRTPTTVGCSGT
jgi:L-alanine-DL-glutamate epimerase-like enolase superfamily enzyme